MFDCFCCKSLPACSACDEVGAQQGPPQAGGGPHSQLLQEQQVVQDRVVRVPLRLDIRPYRVYSLLDFPSAEVMFQRGL